MNKQLAAGGAVLVLLAGGWVVARLSAPATAEAASTSTGQVSTITVTGTADKQVKPDLATIDTGITTKAASAATAQSENDTAMGKLQAALRKAGIAASDIQTMSYNIYPNYSDPGPSGRPTINGFQADDEIEVKVTQLSAVGQLLDTLTHAGANQINNVSYSLKDPSAIELTLYQAALTNADAQATAIAKGIGATITGVQTVSTGDTATPMNTLSYAASGTATQGSAPVSAQSQDVSTSVQVTYTITSGSSIPGSGTGNASGNGTSG